MGWEVYYTFIISTVANSKNIISTHSHILLLNLDQNKTVSVTRICKSSFHPNLSSHETLLTMLNISHCVYNAFSIYHMEMPIDNG